MTISELGSLGEFVGSIAVLFTLVYLTLQVRQSNILAAKADRRARMERMRAHWDNVSMAPDIAPIYEKLLGQAGRNTFIESLIERYALSREEAIRFEAHISALWWGMMTDYDLMDEQMKRSQDHILRTSLRWPINQLYFDGMIADGVNPIFEPVLRVYRQMQEERAGPAA